ncbi:MAG: T9SS type A sorting domain-containing protein [Sphingobacteriaceae bacterium]|nr:T9SS type A sorting domain-containing protein [Sphingobacteriaceae bacterium]
MKKIYILLLTFGLLSVLKSQVASCTLDPTFVASNKKGIWPDSATNFLSGTVGIPYSQNLTIKVPKDTVTNPLTLCFNRIEVSTTTLVTNFNLPPGLNMLGGTNVTVTSGTYKFPGNANTCAQISGTPTTAGSYTLQFKVQPYMTPAVVSCPSSPNTAGGSALSAPTILAYYIINIVNPAGIKEVVNKNSLQLKNFPNPANSLTTIQFKVEDVAPVNISLYNILGELIKEIKTESKVGVNSHSIPCDQLSGGVYFYSISYKNYTETKRFVVSAD